MRLLGGGRAAAEEEHHRPHERQPKEERRLEEGSERVPRGLREGPGTLPGTRGGREEERRLDARDAREALVGEERGHLGRQVQVRPLGLHRRAGRVRRLTANRSAPPCRRRIALNRTAPLSVKPKPTDVPWGCMHLRKEEV